MQTDNKTLTSTQVFIMAVTAGIAVANVYYSQPIFNAIAAQFQISTDKAANTAVLAQIGYGTGLFLLTPLGDMMDRKKLILYLQIGLMTALLLIAFAPTVEILYLGSLLIGVFAVLAQVILPMAASLVKENRGKIVGQLFTGILIGILVARVFSGFITNWLGWSYVYLISAGMVMVTTILMQMDFPSTTERFSGTYGGLLKSTFQQLFRFPLLRRTALTGMLAFGTLSAFWVTLTFYLSGKPFQYSPSQIGMFGLLAAAGALMAPLFGKLADKGSPKRSLLFSTGITLFGILLLIIFPGSVVVIWIAILLLDVGIQATQVTNIAVIYTLDPAANSRINTIYMTSYFIGGALGSYTAIALFEAGGWLYSSLFTGILTILAIANVVTTRHATHLAQNRKP